MAGRPSGPGAVAVVVTVGGLAGCVEQQEAQSLSVSLPTAAALVLVPIALLVPVVRAVRRAARRWPPVEGLDGRHALAVLPVAGAALLVLYAWVYTTAMVAIGYRETQRSLFSWEEMAGLASWVALGVVLVGGPGLALGVGVYRQRTGALVVLGAAAVIALAGQVRLVVVTDESLQAWVIGAVEATYLLVVGSLLRDARRVTTA